MSVENVGKIRRNPDEVSKQSHQDLILVEDEEKEDTECRWEVDRRRRRRR